MRAVHSTAVEYEHYWNQDNLCQTWTTAVKRKELLWNVGTFLETWTISMHLMTNSETLHSAMTRLYLIIYICVHTGRFTKFPKGTFRSWNSRFQPPGLFVGGSLRTPPEDAVAKQLKDAGVEVQTIDETWTRPLNRAQPSVPWKLGRGWKIIQRKSRKGWFFNRSTINSLKHC